MTRCVVLVGNPRAGGRTTRVALAVAEWLGPVDVHVIELAEFGPAVLDPSDERLAAAQHAVGSCELLVVASPTYKATYSGLLKVFLDGLDGGALRGKVAIPVMVGAAASHMLAVELHLRPLLSELGAITPLPGLFAVDSEVDEFVASLERRAPEAAVVRSLLRSRDDQVG